METKIIIFEEYLELIQSEYYIPLPDVQPASESDFCEVGRVRTTIYILYCPHKPENTISFCMNFKHPNQILQLLTLYFSRGHFSTIRCGIGIDNYLRNKNYILLASKSITLHDMVFGKYYILDNSLQPNQIILEG